MECVSQRLHHDEVDIDAGLVRGLLKTQLPRLADMQLRAVSPQGTDNVVFRLGKELSVRLPRKPAAVRGLLIEREWLPRLAPRLPLAVPVPVAVGEPSQVYPFPWTVCTWVSGAPLAPGGLSAYDVEVLANFVLTLQSLDSSGGPSVEPGHRAGPLAAYDPVARAALDGARALKAAGRVEPDLIDEERAATVWAAAVDAAAWQHPGVWVHRDLLGSNLVVVDSRLSGVLDFGGLAVGDPARNVMAAFHLFSSADSRSLFRGALGADEATWVRARGWALTQGLEALVYYLDSHPGMVAMARQAIRATLEPTDKQLA
jgi:aminoglycoside phosphotransferase (APT) family kinase protein